MINGEESNLPAGWVKTALHEVAVLRNEKVEPLSIRSVPYISLEHIESGTNRILNHGVSEDVKSLKATFCSGDVLYGKLRPYLNKVCQPAFDGVCSTSTPSSRWDTGSTPNGAPSFASGLQMNCENIWFRKRNYERIPVL